jgi:hypothetical protein
VSCSRERLRFLVQAAARATPSRARADGALASSPLYPDRCGWSPAARPRSAGSRICRESPTAMHAAARPDQPRLSGAGEEEPVVLPTRQAEACDPPVPCAGDDYDRRADDPGARRTSSRLGRRRGAALSELVSLGSPRRGERDPPGNDRRTAIGDRRETGPPPEARRAARRLDARLADLETHLAESAPRPGSRGRLPVLADPFGPCCDAAIAVIETAEGLCGCGATVDRARPDAPPESNDPGR